MESANDFFSNLKGSMSDQTNSAMVARVERFDASTMMADVLPLVNTENGEIPGMLLDIPVSLLRAGGFIIRPPYKEGDIVLVVFVDRDMDNFLKSGKQSKPETNRTHSLDDAVVVGSVMPFTDSLPGGHANDLVIGTENLSSKIVVQRNGNIIIEGGNVFLGGEAAIEGVPRGDTLKDWLDNHTHSYSWSSSGGSGNTGAPNGSSPKPSSVVKTL